jgi:hypothetical protein
MEKYDTLLMVGTSFRTSSFCRSRAMRAGCRFELDPTRLGLGVTARWEQLSSGFWTFGINPVARGRRSLFTRISQVEFRMTSLRLQHL